MFIVFSLVLVQNNMLIHVYSRILKKKNKNNKIISRFLQKNAGA